MRNDIKSIFESYKTKAGINHTTNNTDSYLYSAKEYGMSRNEQEEKSNLTSLLGKCYELSKAGKKEAYRKLLFDLKEAQSLLQKLL